MSISETVDVNLNYNQQAEKRYLLKYEGNRRNEQYNINYIYIYICFKNEYMFYVLNCSHQLSRAHHPCSFTG